MSINKNQELRRSILDQVFSERRLKYSQQELLNHLNYRLENLGQLEVSRRTLAEDIDYMKNECSKDGIELNYDRLNRKYMYSDPAYSLTGIPVGEKEIQSLSQALAILQQINGLNHSRELSLIIQRLAEKLGLQPETFSHVIQFDQVLQLKGIDFMDRLFKAVVNKEVLRIIYLKYGETKAMELVVHPYFLKEYNNRWYLVALLDDLQKPGIVPLDRMQSVEETDKLFENNKHFKQQAHDTFADIIGVTKPENKSKENIILKFKAARGNYVKTKPLHQSQKVLEDDSDHLKINLEVILNYELIALLLSFGDDLEVLEPDSLREILAEKSLNMVNFYTKTYMEKK